MKGILTASMDGESKTITIKATDKNELILVGVFKVMDLAKDSKLWAKGRIELKDGEGNILNVMEEK